MSANIEQQRNKELEQQNSKLREHIQELNKILKQYDEKQQDLCKKIDEMKILTDHQNRNIQNMDVQREPFKKEIEKLRKTFNSNIGEKDILVDKTRNHEDQKKSEVTPQAKQKPARSANIDKKKGVVKKKMEKIEHIKETQVLEQNETVSAETKRPTRKRREIDYTVFYDDKASRKLR